MARLRGGSSVAGALTVEGLITAAEFVSADGSARALVDSQVAKIGYLACFETNDKIAKAQALQIAEGIEIKTSTGIAGSLRAASIKLEEDGNSVYSLKLQNNSGLTADRTLTFITANADRTIDLTGGNLTVNTGAVTIQGAAAAVIACGAGTTTLVAGKTMEVSDHVHGNITRAGGIGAVAGVVMSTVTSGLLTVLANNATATTYLNGNGAWSTPPNTWTALTGTVSGYVNTQGASNTAVFLNGNGAWSTPAGSVSLSVANTWSAAQTFNAGCLRIPTTAPGTPVNGDIWLA